MIQTTPNDKIDLPTVLWVRRKWGFTVAFWALDVGGDQTSESGMRKRPTCRLL
jgi:hypothetical protein